MVSFVVPRGRSQRLLILLHVQLFENRPLPPPFGPGWSELRIEEARGGKDDLLETTAVAG